MREDTTLRTEPPARPAHSGSAARRWMAAAAAVFVLAGCTRAASDPEHEYLLRVGGRVVTVGDFKAAFETAKSAYPQDLLQNPVLLRNAQTRLLNQLIEEQLLLEKAAQLKLEVSDAELEQAVADIRKDYPDAVFEELLLEEAVSYTLWKNKLRLRLIMQKVVALEVPQAVSITPEEIEAFYREYYRGREPAPDADEESAKLDELLVAQLRRKKTEDAYRLWVEKMRSNCPVDINQSQWNRLTGS